VSIPAPFGEVGRLGQALNEARDGDLVTILQKLARARPPMRVIRLGVRRPMDRFGEREGGLVRRRP